MALYALFSDEAVLRETCETPYASEESFRERVNNPPAGTYTLIAELMLPSGRERVVGAAWLTVLQHRQRHVGRLQLVVQPELRGGEVEVSLLKAALNLADEWLALRRVETIVFPSDEVRLALLAGHGFTHEVTMRRYAVRAGEFAEAWLLARLRLATAANEGAETQ